MTKIRCSNEDHDLTRVGIRTALQQQEIEVVGRRPMQ